MSFTSDFKSFAARLRELISSAECDQNFEVLALELFELQFEYNAPYRRLCEARGVTPGKVEHWSEVPSVPTAAFKELELSCLPIAERTRVFHSSGTTEHRPSRHFHNAESLAVYEVSLWAGFPIRKTVEGRKEKGEPLLILTPPPIQAPHSSLVHMFMTFRLRLGGPDSAYVGRIDDAGAWALDFDAAVDALRGYRDTESPLLLLGTAFSYVHLLDGLAERRLDFELPRGSYAMETGGYKGRSRVMPKPELHSQITRRLGIPRTHILCEYGMSELSSQAYAWGEGGEERSEVRSQRSEDGGVFRFPPWVRAQIVSPETGLEVPEGETGLIRVFDLANVYSVMAVQTEDLGIRRGNGFELIGRAAMAEPRGCSLQAV